MMTRRDSKMRIVMFVLTSMVFCCLLMPHSLKAQDSVLTVELSEGQRIELVWVDGGTFTMGNNKATGGVRHNYEASRPEHQVTLHGYYIGRYEVTQGLWKAVMGENPSKFTGNDSLPVEQVTWFEAQRFVTMLGQMTGHRFRLLTEAEWEYAARGGAASLHNPFPGCPRQELDEYVWFCVNSERQTHPVGQLAPNELGLYDMGGNVAEWCLDWMEPYTDSEQADPRGPKEGDSRVLRGGHYNSVSAACTVYDRSWYVPSAKNEYHGLRLAMDPDEE